MSIKIAILQFPGSNCERETMLAVKRAGMTPLPFLWKDSPDLLASCDGFIIVGGFSYEDRSRAGIIAAMDPVMESLRAQADLGKPVLGLCNGAQILVETGLVPGAEHHALSMALTINKRVQDNQVLGVGYYNAWVHMRITQGSIKNAFNRHITEDLVLCLPVAHAQGRYVMPASTLQTLQQNGQIAFTYCDEAGTVINEFPINPNGSLANIAGITNATGNVLALMPHPERTPLCDALFTSMRDYITENNDAKPRTITLASAASVGHYKKDAGALTLVIDLLITDKEAVSVERALQQAGIPVTVKRQTHWDIKTKNIDTARAQVIASGELFNTNKECIASMNVSANTQSILVRGCEDVIGRNKHQLLSHHFGVKGIDTILHGTLWHITAQEGHDIHDIMPRVLATNILFNPFGQTGQILT